MTDRRHDPECDWGDIGEDCDYVNICCVCGREFIGWKRRVVCKACAKDAPIQVVIP